MRQNLAVAAAAIALSLSPVLMTTAGAVTVNTVSGIQQAIADTSMIEKVVRVCRHNFFTSRRQCFIDRSRPPTVCHWVRDRNGRIVRDCY